MKEESQTEFSVIKLKNTKQKSIYGLIYAVIWGLIWGLVLGDIIGVLYITSLLDLYQNDQEISVLLIKGLWGGLIYGCVYGSIFGLIAGLIFGLIRGVDSALSKSEIKTKITTNKTMSFAKKIAIFSVFIFFLGIFMIAPLNGVLMISPKFNNVITTIYYVMMIYSGVTLILIILVFSNLKKDLIKRFSIQTALYLTRGIVRKEND
ncbi:MAG: hypothetical protein F6K24_00970 [Okeania sp. SIO2D1]|uniref:hypothetical protein n=1 Tax=Okeania sp. SIO2C9 TaxID=2607791 RepID=UPI0013B65940|nr:hypothetical protein [Okeania sp. SIO2C9]NEQ73576.1 hypothetical protein [Okeania sp. SIO2C9]NES63947.1 hypothetical protein [Okeania sp. SIO2D1]